MSEADKPLVWLHGEVKTPPFSKKARVEAGVMGGKKRRPSWIRFCDSDTDSRGEVGGKKRRPSWIRREQQAADAQLHPCCRSDAAAIQTSPFHILLPAAQSGQ
jgi:hypothetical protein